MKAVKSTYGGIELELVGENPKDAMVLFKPDDLETVYLSLNEFYQLMHAGRAFESSLAASIFDHNANPPAWENEGVKS